MGSTWQSPYKAIIEQINLILENGAEDRIKSHSSSGRIPQSGADTGRGPSARRRLPGHYFVAAFGIYDGITGCCEHLANPHDYAEDLGVELVGRSGCEGRGGEIVF